MRWTTKLLRQSGTVSAAVCGIETKGIGPSSSENSAKIIKSWNDEGSNDCWSGSFSLTCMNTEILHLL